MSFYACMKNIPVIEVFKLILNTTDSQAVHSVVDAHDGIATAEVQVSRVRATHRATPIVAARADIKEREITAETRHRPF